MENEAFDRPGRAGGVPMSRRRGLLRRNLPAMLAAFGITVALQVGVFVAARRAMPPDGAAVVTLLMSLLWVVIAAPVFAAGGRTILDGLFRGGIVADASAVVLIVLVAAGRVVSPTGAIGIYMIWCSVVLAECSLVSLARRAAGRHILAAVVVLGVLGVAAGPFWANAILLAAEPPWRERAAFLVRVCNPVFATAECLADEAKFVWNERPILYEYTVLGRDVPVRVAAWYVTVGVYTIFAFAVGAIAAVRRRQGRRSLWRE